MQEGWIRYNNHADKYHFFESGSPLHPVYKNLRRSICGHYSLNDPGFSAVIPFGAIHNPSMICKFCAKKLTKKGEAV